MERLVKTLDLVAQAIWRWFVYPVVVWPICAAAYLFVTILEGRPALPPYKPLDSFRNRRR